MRFLVYDVLARGVALYFLVVSGAELRRAFREREISNFSADTLEWLLGWSSYVVQRKVAPVQFWIQIAVRANILLACVFVVVFGWWHPVPQHS